MKTNQNQVNQSEGVYHALFGLCSTVENQLYHHKVLFRTIVNMADEEEFPVSPDTFETYKRVALRNAKTEEEALTYLINEIADLYRIRLTRIMELASVGAQNTEYCNEANYREVRKYRVKDE